MVEERPGSPSDPSGGPVPQSRMTSDLSGWALSHGQLANAQFRRNNNRARTGSVALATPGIHRGYVSRTVPIAGPGMLVTQAWLSVGSKGYWDRGFVHPRIQFKHQSTTVANCIGRQVQCDSRGDLWQRISMVQMVPEHIAGQLVDHVQVMFEFWRLGDQQGFYVDDVDAWFMPSS